MSFDQDQSVVVCAIPPDQRMAGLELLYNHLSAADKRMQIEAVLSHIANDQSASEGLIGAYRGHVIVGAIFSQLQPGKTAQIWLPKLKAGEESTTAVRILRASVEWLKKNHVQMAQISAAEVLPRMEKVLREVGFDYLADLLYLVAPKAMFPQSPLSSSLEFEPYNPQNHDRLVGILEKTYEGSLDCQKLNQIQNIEDTLESYRATGTFLSKNWLIVRHDNRDVGCLLLADHPQYENLELVYMGIMPEERGHGWGKEIAKRAQLVAQESGRERLVVGVDSANKPAVAMYVAVGFQVWDQRRVFFRVISD